MATISYADLVSFGKQLLLTLGFSEADSRYISETAAFTEAGGVHTHGAIVFANIESQCGSAIDPAAQPVIVNERPATALLDGQRVAGGACLRVATGLAAQKARNCGSAVVSARNTSWIGGLGAYLAPLARNGFFAQLTAQSCACKDAAPYGGIDPVFSTNPMAFAFPSEPDPVIADFSTSAMSMGKVNTLAKAGKTSSQPAFLTSNGELTADPNALLNGGAMLPAGGDFDGHKGFALTLWIEALTAMAGGSCNNPLVEQRQSFTLTVIDPGAFGDKDWYESEVRRMTGRVRSGRRRKGFDAIRLPGERMLTQAAKSKRDGIDMPESTVRKLNEIAKKREIEPLVGQ